MVKVKHIFLSLLCAIGALYEFSSPLYAEDNIAITQFVKADACDERQKSDDSQTAENRAVDKASLQAVKLSGIIQKYYPDLSTSALDIISYRIIDEYMLNTIHKVTFHKDPRICVNLQAMIEITPQELAHLVEEYKNSDTVENNELSAVVDEVKQKITYEPQKIDDRKLMYIDKMSFWNGDESDYYRDILTEAFADNKYFYITDDKSLADYLLQPRLLTSEVDEIDEKHHKMHIEISMDTLSSTLDDFEPLSEKQSHFILFAADKDEQTIADNLIRKLLKKAAEETAKKIENYTYEHSINKRFKK
ncbi:MAG: hypothetical protein IKO06_05485 [Alphaproteobacteria bacterium]|nr:hypothetical protein [Alphaproteobacteria bacterium]